MVCLNLNRILREVIGISTERWLGEYYPIAKEKEPAVEEVVDEEVVVDEIVVDEEVVVDVVEGEVEKEGVVLPSLTRNADVLPE